MKKILASVFLCLSVSLYAEESISLKAIADERRKIHEQEQKEKLEQSYFDKKSSQSQDVSYLGVAGYLSAIVLGTVLAPQSPESYRQFKAAEKANSSNP